MEYKVEKIIGHRRIPRDDHIGEFDPEGYEFKVRWDGYGSDEETWEPSSNLTENRLFGKYCSEKGLIKSNGHGRDNETEEKTKKKRERKKKPRSKKRDREISSEPPPRNVRHGKRVSRPPSRLISEVLRNDPVKFFGKDLLSAFEGPKLRSHSSSRAGSSRSRSRSNSSTRSVTILHVEIPNKNKNQDNQAEQTTLQKSRRVPIAITNGGNGGVGEDENKSENSKGDPLLSFESFSSDSSGPSSSSDMTTDPNDQQESAPILPAELISPPPHPTRYRTSAPLNPTTRTPADNSKKQKVAQSARTFRKLRSTKHKKELLQEELRPPTDAVPMKKEKKKQIKNQRLAQQQQTEPTYTQDSSPGEKKSKRSRKKRKNFFLGGSFLVESGGEDHAHPVFNVPR